ncbi:ribonuclease YeeF family protein [Listeria welshimeri]|uniref:ribonuclease YeeF family protein n=1 Tax=Listeria welshimeri TaxID=1643 RepID=UPI001888EE2D|nr:ribonuclease YeeF family protein [Listeria welshimeri]MBF2614698.1 ribonuclease YeeF family protein [Listeria welshimeri]
MKDINYQEDDWREAKSALAPFAAANWMGGLFNNLVKVAENMEEAEADIQELDSDGAISFQHTNHTGKYSTIEEDLLVLYKFCCHAGERMENLVNLPFYEKLDAFVGGMQELSISTYATTNRMEVKEQRTVTTGEYAQSFETIKAEVTMEDLLNGDNFYANQMQLQYRDWKRANPDQDVSEADFKMSMIHTRAFEYKSIKNEQEEKEFWVSIVATVGIIAVSVLCPPAGLALSVAYGGLEISSAVSGKDWFSGRELSTGERYTRAGFGVLDVIPGVKAFTTGAKAVGTGSKLLRLGDNVLADSKNIGRLAKGTMGEGLQAGKQAMHLRLSNAQKIANQAGANVQRKLAKDWNDLGAAAKAIQGKAKQAIPLAPRERLALAGAGGSIPEQSVAGASAAATKKKLQEMMQKMDNLNVKGSGKADIIEGANGLDYLDNQLGSMKNNIKVNKYESAESVNNWWKIQGYNQPPYTPKTIVQEITLLEDTKLVRVYDGVESGLYGGWVMRAEDIKGLTPLQIQEKFALPQLPEFIGEVTLPKGSTIRAGEVNPLFGSKGGGFQFDMMQQRIGEFREIGKIIDWSGK